MSAEQAYTEYPFVVASALKSLDERKAEIDDALQNMARSEKLFDSHYFRNKLKGTLEDCGLVMQKARKLVRDLSAGRDELEALFPRSHLVANCEEIRATSRCARGAAAGGQAGRRRVP